MVKPGFETIMDKPTSIGEILLSGCDCYDCDYNCEECDGCDCDEG